MRCLITGGAGFIGSHLVEHLDGAGHDVVVLDDLSTGHRENFAAVRRRISFMRGSVADLSACRRAMEGADYVWHHAAVTAVQRSVIDPGAAHTVNATGTLNVLLAARDARVRRVVYAGSTSAYGNSAVLPNREDHVANPLGPYARSEEHTSELQSPCNLVCRLLLEKKTIQAHGIAVTIRAIGYQCGPNSGPRFQVAIAPMVQTTNPMNPMNRARPIGWSEASRAMMR